MNRKGMRPTHEEDRVRCRAVPSVRRRGAGNVEHAAPLRCRSPSLSLQPSPLDRSVDAASCRCRRGCTSRPSWLAASCCCSCLAVRYLPGVKVDGRRRPRRCCYVVSESLWSRGSRDLLTISLGSVVTMAAIPLVGGLGRGRSSPGRPPSRTSPEHDRSSSALFNGASSSLSAGAAGGAYHGSAAASSSTPLTLPLRARARSSRPTSCTAPSTADSSRSSSDLDQRVSPLRGLPGHDGPFGAARTSATACSASRSRSCGTAGASVGPAAAVLAPAAAVRRAMGVRAVRRGAAGVRPHRPHADGRRRDQGRLHPRPQRAGVGRLGAHRPGDRHARGPGRLAALRRHAARRRQARRPDPGAAEVRRPHRRRVRGHPAAPGAGPGDRPRDRVPRRGERRDHAPPRAARRPRLPDGPARRPRSRSSPGSSRSPTRSTR